MKKRQAKKNAKKMENMWRLVNQSVFDELQPSLADTLKTNHFNLIFSRNSLDWVEPVNSTFCVMPCSEDVSC